MSDIDICVVGAGAAGIAAARHARAAGRSVIVLEAADRLGGRAFTAVAGGWPLDLGCGWLHSAERNSWARHAAEAGVAIDRTLPPWMKPQSEIGFSAAEQAAFGAAREAFEAKVDEGRDGADRPASDFLEAYCRWNPLLDALSSYINGAGLGALSVHDYLAYEDAASEENWRLPAGYGALVAGAAEGLDVRLATPVKRIDHWGALVRVETARGTVDARAAIVTVSTAMLAAGRPAFDPPLPGKRESAAALPLGLADKVTLAVEGAGEFPAETGLFGRIDTAETANFHLRPFGRPLFEAYLGGRHADALEAEGPGASTDFCTEQLAGLLGSGIRRRLTPVAASAWRRAAHVGGSYSHALPGRSAARAALAAPVDGRLFFAGEATSAHDFSTCHGAHDSGTRAADEALAALSAAH